MSSGIKPKVAREGKTFNEHAKRYVFYPLSNLDFASSQFISPIWSPKIPKGRFVLLESCEYMTQVADEGEQLAGANGVRLGMRVMGTDAQVKFLMGNTDGTGYMDKGMTAFDCLTDVDPRTAAEIEALLLPVNSRGDITIPEDLVAFEQHLLSLKVEGDTPVHTLAREAQADMLAGVRRGINWCRSYTNQLEQELRDGQSGGIGIKYLSETNKFYFTAIRKPFPEDRQGANMGAELAKVLATALNPSGASKPSVADSVELDELRRRLEEANKTIEEQGDVITALSEEGAE